MSDRQETKAWDGRPPGDAAKREGWHWCYVYRSLPFPVVWRGDSPIREWSNGYTAEQAAQHWNYLGPCLLPDEVDAAIALARLATLREMACGRSGAHVH